MIPFFTCSLCSFVTFDVDEAQQHEDEKNDGSLQQVSPDMWIHVVWGTFVDAEIVEEEAS